MHHFLIPIVCVASIVLAPTARADEVYTFVVKSRRKKSRGWNLADWLDTRDKMRLQDLWLSLHSPSPFEFFLGVDYRMLESNSMDTFGARVLPGPPTSRPSDWRRRSRLQICRSGCFNSTLGFSGFMSGHQPDALFRLASRSGPTRA